MMLTESDLAYIVAIATTIRTKGKNHLDAPVICPECGDLPDDGYNWDEGHLTLESDVEDERPIILIGCEGYHTVDPSLIGMPSGNWGRYRHCDE